MLLLLLLLQLCPGSHGQTAVADGFPVLAAVHGHARCGLWQSSSSLVSAEAQLQQVMADINDGGGEGIVTTQTTTTPIATQTAAMAAPEVSAWPTRRIGAAFLPVQHTDACVVSCVGMPIAILSMGGNPRAGFLAHERTCLVTSRVGPGRLRKFLLPSSVCAFCTYHSHTHAYTSTCTYVKAHCLHPTDTN